MTRCLSIALALAALACSDRAAPSPDSSGSPRNGGGGAGVVPTHDAGVDVDTRPQPDANEGGSGTNEGGSGTNGPAVVCPVDPDRSSPPVPTLPADGAVTFNPHPELKWASPSLQELEYDDVRVDIATDATFDSVVRKDTIGMVDRYIPADPLAPGRYWWRLAFVAPARLASCWSAPRMLEVQAPPYKVTVPAGATAGAFIAAVKDAATHTPALVEMTPATYDFAQAANPTPLLDVSRVQDLIIDGKGATIRLPLRSTFLAVDYSQNVVLRNLTVVQSPRGVALAKVAAVNATMGTVTLKVEPGYEDNLPLYLFPGNGNSFLRGFEFTNDADRIRWSGSFSNVAEVPAKVADAWVVRPTAGTAQFAVGSLLLAYTGAGGFVTGGRTRDLRLVNITLVECPNAIFETRPDESTALFDVRGKLYDAQGFLGANGLMLAGRSGPWLERVELDTTQDDAMNAQQAEVHPSTRPSPTEWLLAETWTPAPMTGDLFDLYDGKYTTKLGTATVASAALDPATRRWLVTFTTDQGALPADVVGQNWGGSVEGMVVRNSRFINIQGYGIRFRGKKLLVENNVIQNTGGFGIDIGSGSFSNLGLEGWSADSVLIRGNQLLHTRMTPIAAWSQMRGEARHVFIIDNEVVDYPDQGIRMDGARDVLIEGNEFASDLFSSVTTGTRYGVTINRSDAVTARNNRFTDARPLASHFNVGQDVTNVQTSD